MNTAFPTRKDDTLIFRDHMIEDKVTYLKGAQSIMSETMREGAIMLASDGTILCCNQHFADMVKGSLEKVIASSIYRYISSADLQLFETSVYHGLKEDSKVELSLQTLAENSVPVLLSVCASKYAKKHGVVCLAVNELTEQKCKKIEKKVLQRVNNKPENMKQERIIKYKTTLSEINKTKDQPESGNIYFRNESKMKHRHEHIIGQSDGLNYALYRAKQVAPANTTVLIQGETGTGKELIAAAIHEMSPRKQRPLITVNCAALPENLIESELFGREKGAFTGADTRQIGRFEVANGSTLCLDEIGELPLEMQAKLLRVIQHNEFERLGSSHTIKVDVRILATTNRNLEEEVHMGRFRQDLYYRLNVFPITVPPLRERAEDIPRLVQTFAERCAKKLGKRITSISKETLMELQGYPWPGNIRELESIIERAVILCQGPTLQLPDQLKVYHPASTTITLDDINKNQIIKILSKTGWRINGKNGAAEILGLHPSTLRARMHKLSIVRPKSCASD
ncbi:sigma-54 interaction domain-containing protein [Desulfobacterium sp. N47]|uniref:Formate hydrogenlyase transcriptional activator n=1 Tax=uncultured Desulfobacterium sp. TaxID=201089 RepID=E1YGC2_9BACT|nr:Formate hydrogenlyase transcriptional activator [uncultured Desulfobacterium sp.]